MTSPPASAIASRLLSCRLAAHSLLPAIRLQPPNASPRAAGSQVKVSDFGWSRFASLDSGKTFFHGWQWVAPEILAGGRYSEEADIYSFAMVAWEVLTQSLPFAGLNPIQIGLAVREKGMRPQLPDDCPTGFGELLCACWQEDAARRHSFTKILGRLQALSALGEF